MDKARGVRRRKHALIGAELTAFTQSWLPGRSPVNDEYGDLVAIAQRHILPTATTHSGEATNIALIDERGIWRNGAAPRRSHFSSGASAVMASTSPWVSEM
jgi:hypothetical protein